MLSKLILAAKKLSYRNSISRALSWFGWCYGKLGIAQDFVRIPSMSAKDIDNGKYVIQFFHLRLQGKQ